MTNFVTGFLTVSGILLLICGGATAIVLSLAVLWIIDCVAGLILDRVAQTMFRRWERKGIQPKGKLGKILRSYYQRQRD